MLSSVVIEDLEVAVEYLRHCCKKNGHVDLKAAFRSINEALEFLNNNKVDLLFLDIEMQEESNGFDLLDRLTYTPKVILTTSKTEYAFDAFEYNVSDFLKKPYSFQRFQSAINKVLTASTSNTAPENEDDFFFIKSDGKLIRLINENILYVESLGDYVKFVTTDKKYISHNTIKYLEEKMNADLFIKVHRSYIINIKKVTNVKDNFIYIFNEEIPISKSNRSAVMKRINVI